jgi:eukaryotic-like serine/threonine-protein kinase
MAGAGDLRSLLRFGGFELDRQSGELRKHGLKIKLADQPFQILALLLERPSQVVTRDELQRKLWAADTFVDFDRGLNKAINRLRDALGDSADHPRFIETLPKRGYRFIASVEPVPSSGSSAGLEAAGSIPAPSAGAQTTNVRSRTGIWWIVAAGVLLAGATAGWLYFRPARMHPQPNTIVLTEFDNHTGESAFDYTLKQALRIDLDQSPFLRILSDQDAANTLRLMGRKPDQQMTPQGARELCLRAGAKAVLGGSIGRLGSEYVLNLTAINCQSGEMIAEEQLRAAAKEQVLRGLDQAASRLRAKLGESLSSIRRFDRPLTDFVSTSSLEAFQAYVNGQKVLQQKGRPYAVPFFRRAVDLDPNFALAYVQLAILYDYLGELKLSAEITSKAYALREQVSEPERFMISSQYFLKATEQPEKVLSICQLWSQSYPEDGSVHERTSWAYMMLGEHEKALAESKEAFRKRGDLPITAVQLVRGYLFLNRLDEAKTLLEKEFTQNPDQLFWREGIYLLAFFDGDSRRMEDQVSWAKHTPGAEDSLLAIHSATNAYFGRLKKARELSRLAVEFAQHNELRERAALLIAAQALREAWLENADVARLQSRAALNLLPGKDVRTLAGLALARVGDSDRATKLADQLSAEFSSSTLIQKYWLPAIRATVDLSKGDYSRAIEELRATEPYELADTPAPLSPVYIRAEALLRAHQAKAAATEFRKVLEHRGMLGNSLIGVTAHLGLARAYAQSGENGQARDEYRKFFELWKDADSDIPLLGQARAELPKLE